MKIVKINSLTTILFILLISSLTCILPIALIETLWNTTVAKSFDVSINLWQALILWLSVLVILNIMGVFKFEFAVESLDDLDKESMKKKLEALKNKIEDINETESKPKNHDKD